MDIQQFLVFMFSGTYSNKTHLKSSDQCTPCPSGKYCSGTSNKIWDGYCEAGYWCIQGASHKAPTDGVSGHHCSPGYGLSSCFFASSGQLRFLIHLSL